MDATIILLTAIVTAILINEQRRDNIPMLPACLNNKFYREIKLSTFTGRYCGDKTCLIFDARPHELYKKNRLEGSLNFPVSQFDFFYKLYLSDTPRDIPIFIYGRTTSQAFDCELAYRLATNGYKNIMVIQ